MFDCNILRLSSTILPAGFAVGDAFSVNGRRHGFRGLSAGRAPFCRRARIAISLQFASTDPSMLRSNIYEQKIYKQNGKMNKPNNLADANTGKITFQLRMVRVGKENGRYGGA